MAVDAAGGIVILGQANFYGSDPAHPTAELAVAKLTASGALDATFGTGGTFLIPPPAGDTSFGPGNILIDKTGNIIAAGTVGGGNTSGQAVVRLTPTGALDPTFNGGKVDVVAGTSGGLTLTATIDSFGRIVIAGESGGPASDFTAARLNTDGSLDTTFAGTGVINFHLTSVRNDIATAVATDAAGNIFLGGNDAGRQVVLKLTNNGSLDTSFGTGGVFTDPFGDGPGPYLQVTGLAVLPDGRVIAAANLETISGTTPRNQFTVFALTSGGQLDPSFNPNGPNPGANTFGFNGVSYPIATALDITPTGDIVVAGYDSSANRSDMDVARLIGPGEGKKTYGGTGAGTGASNTTPVNPFASLGVSVRTAVGDVNGDGIPDTIYITGPGTPLRVAVVSGADNKTLIVPPFDPFGGNFTGGGFVTAADFDHSGRDQVVVAADVGGSPRIAIWSLLPDGQSKPRASFFGITGDPNFRGGARVAVGDVDHDGTPDLVVAAGYGGGPRVAVFDGKTLLSGNPTKLVNDFYAFPADARTLRAGVYVAVGDVNGDGYGDLIFGAGPGGGPRVLVVSGKTLVAAGPAAALVAPVSNFFAGGSDATRTGTAVAVTRAAKDGVADVAAGPPAGTRPVVTSISPVKRVSVYAGSALTAGPPPTPAMTIDPTTDLVLAPIFVG